ncbi:hypothetical protein PVK06_011033 [Gossypium arboreum]|uniref:Uncharacterized protein n=1 Tax=Gossypium arboreum TaxID=29729 RepID=A0ABR0Q7S0_GOSAR|nr:hypothetical protein PVK06_011033 [Gossypium arboreum]
MAKAHMPQVTYSSNLRKWKGSSSGQRVAPYLLVGSKPGPPSKEKVQLLLKLPEKGILSENSDSESSYYITGVFLSSIQRRKFNQINALRNQAGEWIYDLEDIQNETINYFYKLYREVSTPIKGLPPSTFLQLD